MYTLENSPLQLRVKKLLSKIMRTGEEEKYLTVGKKWRKVWCGENSKGLEYVVNGTEKKGPMKIKRG
jgi:hypothetical protein